MYYHEFITISNKLFLNTIFYILYFSEVISVILILQNFQFVNYSRKKYDCCNLLQRLNFYRHFVIVKFIVKFIVGYDHDNNYCRTNFPDAETVCLIGNNSAGNFLTLSSVKPFERHAARLKPAAALMLRKCLTIGPGDRSLQWYYREIRRVDASPVIRVTVHLRTILCHCCRGEIKAGKQFRCSAGDRGSEECNRPELPRNLMSHSAFATTERERAALLQITYVYFAESAILLHIFFKISFVLKNKVSSIFDENSCKGN